MLFKVLAPPTRNRFPLQNDHQLVTVLFDRVESFEMVGPIELLVDRQPLLDGLDREETPKCYLGPVWDEVILANSRRKFLYPWNPDREDPSLEHFGPDSGRPNRQFYYLFGDYREDWCEAATEANPTGRLPLKVNYVTLRRRLDNDYILDEHIVFNTPAYVMTEEGKTFEKYGYTYSSVTRK